MLKKKRALGTTVFHFVQGAKAIDPVLKELMRRIKTSQYDHDLVMQPFMLSVALGLTSIDYIKQTVNICHTNELSIVEQYIFIWTGHPLDP